MIIFNLLFWTFIYKVSRYMSHGSERTFLKDWSTKKDSRMLSFYVVSTVHSLIMSTFPLYYLYHSGDYDLVKPFEHNQIMLVDLALSYFLWDLYYVYLHNDYMYLVHHTLGMIYMIVFKNFPLANLFMVSIFLPEVTTPILNLWTLGKMKKYSYFDNINRFFTFFYIFVRVFMIITFNIYAFMELYDSDHIPQSVTLFLLAVTCFYCFGNIMWSRKLLRGYKKWSASKSEQSGSTSRSD